MQIDRKKYIVFLFFISTLIFILLLDSIDIYNTRVFLYFTSFFDLSLNPYQYYAIPTPPIFISLLLPQFYIYRLTTSLVLASDFMRIINLIFLISSALIAMKMTSRLTGDRIRYNAIFYGILFSPFLFFVNFIFNEQDMLSIFLLLSSIYLLLFENKIELKFAGGLLLAYTSFFYFFPILIIPTLLVYEKTKRSLISLLILVSFSFLILFILFQKDLNWSIFGNGAGLVSSSVGTVPLFSILNLIPGAFLSPFTSFLSNLNYIMDITVLVLVFTIPIISRYYHRSIFMPLSVILLLPFLFFKIYNYDEFVWIIPFSSIYITANWSKKHLTSKVLLSQLCLLPATLIFNMYAAPGFGQGTGVFYLLYDQFHYPLSLYSVFPDYIQFTELLDLVGFSLILSLGLVIVTSSKSENTDKNKKNGNNG